MVLANAGLGPRPRGAEARRRRARGAHQLLRRVNCAYVVAGCARTGWLRSGWQREQKDSLFQGPAD